MKNSLSIIFIILLNINSLIYSQQVTVSNSGWTITADSKSGTLNFAHVNLGDILNNVKINLQEEDVLTPLIQWSAEKINDRQVSVHTVNPLTAWMFSIDNNMLTISSTSTEMVLTAEAPASTERIVARLMERTGFPVNWVGTDENLLSFGGKEYSNPSFIPQKNPDVMTFALGHVSASNLHSLFDRQKDIAITFSEHTLMERMPQQPEVLEITMPVYGNTVIRLIPDYYTKTLGLPSYKRFDDSVFPTAPVLWCSWTAYYRFAREKDIVRNTDWLSANLKPYGFQYIQIDDGYDNGEEGMMHYWISNWDKRGYYPKGPEWIARYIKSKGLKPGLWLVPNSYAGAVKDHPDWYLRDKSGNLIPDYSTPTLDFTHPGVQDWLTKLFTTLKGWGYEYYKFDGEFPLPEYAPQIDKSRLYDKTIDPITAYHNRLQLIRNAVGPETFIEGCQAGTPLHGIGYFNSSFAGADVYNSWQGMYALFSSINANAFLNHIVIYLMPGEGIDVSPWVSVEQAQKNKMVPKAIEVAKTREEPLAGFGVTLPEARTLVSHVSLTGVVYPLASVMPDVTEERARLLKMTMPTLPILPVDLYSRGSDITWNKFKETTPDTYIHNYPEIINLKINAKSGIYDIAGLTNWRSSNITRSLDFSEKLGLKAGSHYVVFDFWEQKLLGIYEDSIRVDIEPHDTRVLLIHQLLKRPQLIGNSRHITGAYSIVDLNWDEKQKILNGSSQSVPGDDYSLYFYIPSGFSTTQVKATAGNKDIPISRELSGNMLKLTFKGVAEAVSWEVGFK